MISRGIFIDTWGWIALGYKKESRHRDISEFYRNLHREKVKIYTSDYIIDEVITLLFRRENFMQALSFVKAILKSSEQGYIVIEKIAAEHFNFAWELRQKFTDKPYISFTDLTSMAVMQELGIKQILTDDRHFSQTGMGFQILPGCPG